MQLHALSQLSSVIAVLLFWSNFCLAFDSSKSITNLHYHAQEALEEQIKYKLVSDRLANIREMQ